MRIALIVSLTVSCALCCTVQENLYRNLLADYTAAVDPGRTALKLNVSLLCAFIDKKTNFLTVNAWETYTWKDSRLKWNPSDFGGLQRIMLPSKSVWTPDFRHYNSITGDIKSRDCKANVAVSCDGTMLWIPVVNYKTACLSENCKIRIASWTYSANTLDLKPDSDDPVDLEFYDDQCPMVISNHHAKLVDHTYKCCNERFPGLEISITVKPK